MAGKQKSKTYRILTPPFRVSFPNVFKAKAAFENQEPTFNLQMLFPKDGPMKADLSAIKKMCQEVAKERFGAKLPGTTAKPFNWPLRDGNEKADLQNYKGMVFCNAKSKNKPGVVDRDKQEIIDPADLYAGCWARATISIFAYEKMGNVGVAFGLDNIQKVKDDKSFGGKRAATDDFEIIEDLGEMGFESNDETVEQMGEMDF